MKNKSLLLIITSVFTCAVFHSAASAQNAIPNSGFENWITNQSGVLVPADWEVYYQAGDTNFIRVAPGYKGSYALEARVVYDKNTLQNVAAYSQNSKTISLTSKPVNFTAYIKTKIMPSDSAGFDVSIYKGTSIVGTAHYAAKTNFTGFTFIQVPIKYNNGVTSVDSALVNISAGDLTGSQPKKGTQIIVDEVAFDGTNTTGIPAITPSNNNGSFFYPNPVTENSRLYVNLTQETVVNVAIYNVLGQVEYTMQTIGDSGTHSFSIPTEKLKNGAHLCKITTSTQQETIKIIINQ